jgi:hypothetical protein
MTTYYLNGQIIPEGSDFTVGDFTYPYTWLEGTSTQIRSSLGIFKNNDVNYDPKYYWHANIAKPLEDIESVDQDGNPVFVKTLIKDENDNPVMIDSDVRMIQKGLKTNCLAEIKNTTNKLLSSTDFYIIRNEVENLEIPETVLLYRADVLAESERLDSEISAVETVEDLIEIMNTITWPKPE